MKVVIIGGGTAGMAVAVHLRRHNEKAEIIILEKSSDLAMATCGLPFLISGEVKDAEMLQGASVEEMRKIFNVEVRLNCEVLAIKRETRQLLLKDTPPLTYDKLILATGALQLRPDIAGILSENVFTLNTAAMVRKAKDYYLGTGARQVLILGGGKQGIEIALAFCRLNAETIIVEQADHILAHADEDMAAIMQNKLRDMNIMSILNDSVREFRANTAILQSGRQIEFDIAIITTGKKTDIKLPVLAGLEIGETGGLKVNDRMQTNDENIYACGENVEINNFIAHSTAATLKQARTAAENINGKNARLTNAGYAEIVGREDLYIAIAGKSENELLQKNIPYGKVHLWQDDTAPYLRGKSMIFKLLYSEKGKILGMQAVGSSGIVSRAAQIDEIIRSEGTYKDLAAAELFYAPELGTAKDVASKLGSMIEEAIKNNVKYAYYDGLNQLQGSAEQIWLDVRTEKSFQHSHIPQALNFPLAVLRQNIHKLAKDKSYVLYDNRGYGAYIAYMILRLNGFAKLQILSGGLDLYLQQLINEEN